MSLHVLLNLLNELRKKKPFKAFYLFFKFNYTIQEQIILYKVL